MNIFLRFLRNWIRDTNESPSPVKNERTFCIFVTIYSLFLMLFIRLNQKSDSYYMNYENFAMVDGNHMSDCHKHLLCLQVNSITKEA